MQRFCLTLNLRPDPSLIAEYVERHRAVWPEVLQSLRDSGITAMEIYLEGTQLCLIMDTTDDFTLERKGEMDRANAVVMRWEAEMAKYQIADPGTDASGRWRRMERVFAL